ncbi:NHLP family bacteriocin export ABC transporter peptidase/permease/ATPase subunit [Streptomyces sp. NBC_00285]|uniref:NHLP family bacteriocin export ABC transporter peptidase/permease/ATPase subunit n=1 Tax=Streptomyces sp. NBC_00285 TaxID=2975700 RepID=UPI002E2AED51|nr:NHLP family bacteriocin export ABC transporter peptidase/permease/ATPase subunit [Streptomyces sp. NBC_00285]
MTTDLNQPAAPTRRGRHRAPRGASGGNSSGSAAAGPSEAKRTLTTRRRVKTPTVLQMEAVECGAAALAMILAHFGKYVGLQRLRILCGISRDGSRASHLVKAARALGLEAGGHQTTTEVLATLPAPAILFWEFNHFVVWEGQGRRLGKLVVYLNDPAQGRRVLTPEQFSDGFTGIVLTFRPGADFVRDGKAPGKLANTPARLKGTYGALVFALSAALMLAGVSTVIPAFTRGFIEGVFTADGNAPFFAFFGMMATAVLLTVVLVHTEQTYLLRAQLMSSTLSTARFLRHLLRLPIAFFSQRSPADVAHRLGMNHQIAERLSQTLSSAVVNAVVAVLYAALMWTYSPILAVIGISISLLHIVLTRVVVRLRSDGVAKLAVDTSKLISTSFSGLQLIETMKATGGERGYFRRWGDQQAALLYQQQVVSVPSALLSSIGPLLTTLNVAVILTYGGLQAVAGNLSIGLLIAFQVVLSNFSRPVAELSNLAPIMQDTVADVTRIKDVEAEQQDAVFTRPEPDRTKRLSGHLRFNTVTFGYGRLSPPLLNGFSFEIKPGHQLALVGGSGSGKSTVSRLIAGLYDPWSGSIEFDGKPHTTVSRSVLAASVAFVDQDVFLFEGTVRDNVTLWDPSLPDEAVMAALRDACMDDVVAARPGGIHSRVEQDGRNFSGGQRQRMEIARALVRNPSVLVLDEATSALDAETEQRISENLRRRGCACVLIAHRLSTIRSSDEIIVLDAGRAIERGTHHELVARAGVYSSLVLEA